MVKSLWILTAVFPLAACSGDPAASADSGTDADSDADADTESDAQVPPDCPTALVPACEPWPGSKLEVNEQLDAADLGSNIRLVAASYEIAIGERLSEDGNFNDLVVVPRMGWWFDHELTWSVPIGASRVVDLAVLDWQYDDVYLALVCSDVDGCRLYGITPRDWSAPEIVLLQNEEIPAELEPRGLVLDLDGSFLLFGNGIFLVSMGNDSHFICPASDLPRFNAVSGRLAAGDQGRLAALSLTGCEELPAGTSATLSAIRTYSETYYAVGTTDGRIGLREGGDIAWHEISTAAIADLSDSGAWRVLDSAGCVYKRSNDTGFCVLAAFPGTGIEIAVWDCGDVLNEIFITSEGIYDFGAVCNMQ